MKGIWEFDGFGEFGYRLRTADDVIREEAIKGVRQATAIVYETAVTNAPVGETRRLVTSMKWDVQRPRTAGGNLRHRYEGRIFFDLGIASYGPFQEEGTGVYGPSGMSYVVFTRSTSRLVSGRRTLGYYLHPGVPAQKFIEHAVDTNRQTIQVIFNKTGRNIARKIARGRSASYVQPTRSRP